MRHSQLVGRSWIGFGFLVALLARGATAQTTARVSIDSAGVEANGASSDPRVSADGRYVVFRSLATNLVTGDTNGVDDVFVHDRQTGGTTRVSVDSSGVEGNGASGGLYGLSISDDGRFVAFKSLASNLVAGDTNGSGDVFVHDSQTGTTSRISVDSGGAQGNGLSDFPALSGDGRYVAFLSDATNLVPADTNGTRDAYVHDRQTATTTRVNVDSSGAQGNGFCHQPHVSSDGRWVAFSSLSTNLVAGDTNGFQDIFVHDMQTGTTVRVSVDSFGAQAVNGSSHHPEISADGSRVVFTSSADNLFPGDTVSLYDVFVHDVQTGETRCLSVDSSGAQGPGGGGDSNAPVLSDDGRHVAFASVATKLVPADSNLAEDVFHRDTGNGVTNRASLTSSAAQATSQSYLPDISGDGRFVVFASSGTTLVAGDTNGVMDIFVRDREPANLTASCFGDGTGAACPCGNTGQSNRGCQNSASTGGAVLAATGVASVAGDSLRFTAYGERPTSLSIFVQGSTSISAVNYGDGLRCFGGVIKRLYVKNAVGGVVAAPVAGDPSVSVRSAALGDPLSAGATRTYQVYYRDPTAGFCDAPSGSTYSIGNALTAVWDP